MTYNVLMQTLNPTNSLRAIVAIDSSGEL